MTANRVVGISVRSGPSRGTAAHRRGRLAVAADVARRFPLVPPYGQSSGNRSTPKVTNGDPRMAVVEREALMRQSVPMSWVRPLKAAGLMATLILTAAAAPEGGLADPTIVAAILALVAVGVAALLLVRRRRAGTDPMKRPPTEGE